MFDLPNENARNKELEDHLVLISVKKGKVWDYLTNVLRLDWKYQDTWVFSFFSFWVKLLK